MPEGVLPGRRYAVSTIGTAIQEYTQTAASYREVTIDVGNVALPLGETRTTFWTSVTKPSSAYPSTVFRWVARFAGGAEPWRVVIAAATQEILSHPLFVPARPGHLDAKARTAAKHEQLIAAWYLLAVLFLFAGLLREPVRNWPHILLRAPRRPAGLDRTEWFVRACRAPP